MTDTDLLIAFIAEELLATELPLGADDPLLVDGMVDSIGIMRLVEFMEDTFDVIVPAEDILIENFNNVSSIQRYLARRRAA